jgi:hypothetical protein
MFFETDCGKKNREKVEFFRLTVENDFLQKMSLQKRTKTSGEGTENVPRIFLDVAFSCKFENSKKEIISFKIARNFCLAKKT